MSHGDRERRFEQALQRHLRRDGTGARNETDAHAAVPDETAGTVECPDADMLAAFHESMLSSEEMNATTEHVAGCSRCQQILLLLETTDEIPLPVEAENDLKVRESVLSTGALYVDYAGRQTPNLTLAGQPTPASKAPQDISRGRGFKTLRWAAPAGAIAAGLLIWIVLRDHKAQNAHVENVQIAQQQSTDERPATLRALPASPALPAPALGSKALNGPLKDEATTHQLTEEPGAVRAQERYSPNVKAKSANRVAASSNPTIPAPASGCPTDVPMASRQCDHLVVLAPSSKAEPQPQKQGTDAVSASAAPIDTSAVDLTNQSAVPAPPASSASADAAVKKAGTMATQTVVLECPVAQFIPTEQVATPDKLHAPSFETDGITAQGKNIVAPGGLVLWRLGTKGQVDRSMDCGISWMQQRSGVKSELLAGSAPNDSVCWIFSLSM